MSARSPVITGLGLIGAPGFGLTDTWQFLRAGKSGLKPLTLFQSPRYGQMPAGEAPLDLIKLGAPTHGSRSDQLGWLAARAAIASAGIDLKNNGERAGVILGSSVGGSHDSERFLTTLIKQGKMRARPARFHECVSVVDLIAHEFGLLGPGMAVATACSSGALAIATAAEMIQSGEADIMLTGGADSLSRMTWGGFHSLLLVDDKGCRPFDANRAGTSMGEGAGILILESEASARKRGAKILARLSGWGSSCDAHHATAPHPEGAGAIAAMQAALRRAGLLPAEINYVNAHGTGTRDNDVAEARALKGVFGNSVPPFSSTKQFFGHALAASGAMEAVVCVEALQRQEIPGNPGFTVADPKIGLEPVTQWRALPLTHVMSNSFGFGGNNAVLIFSRPDALTQTFFPENKSVAVMGLGKIGPGAISIREIEPPLPAGKIAVHDCGELDLASLTSNQRRRLSRLVQMALLAARKSHTPVPAQRLSIAIGTGLGCLTDAVAFLENLVAKDEREPMPARFPNSVHNAASAQVAMDFHAHGSNFAPTAGEISFECALWHGMRQLAANETDVALVGAVDELNKYPLALGLRWKLSTEKNKPGEGAVMASLAQSEAVSSSLAHVASVHLGRYRAPFDPQHEAEWIASKVDLSQTDTLITGAGEGSPLDEKYQKVLLALAALCVTPLQHKSYKPFCGEFHSASAFGFSMAVDLVRGGSRGVLLYTLGLRGAKALSSIQP
ncbi:MAG: beta-ketoacyl-[acyl-carrier-protein] synthase family protein [Verrucomicrobiota bacterium]